MDKEVYDILQKLIAERDIQGITNLIDERHETINFYICDMIRLTFRNKEIFTMFIEDPRIKLHSSILFDEVYSSQRNKYVIKKLLEHEYIMDNIDSMFLSSYLWHELSTMPKVWTDKSKKVVLEAFRKNDVEIPECLIRLLQVKPSTKSARKIC